MSMQGILIQTVLLNLTVCPIRIVPWSSYVKKKCAHARYEKGKNYKMPYDLDRPEWQLRCVCVCVCVWWAKHLTHTHSHTLWYQVIGVHKKCEAFWDGMPRTALLLFALMSCDNALVPDYSPIYIISSSFTLCAFYLLIHHPSILPWETSLVVT